MLLAKNGQLGKPNTHPTTAGKENRSEFIGSRERKKAHHTTKGSRKICLSPANEL